MVVDESLRNPNEIRIRFNKLCRQFAENNNYIVCSYNLIPEDENIYSEYFLNNKRYEAVFYQMPTEATFDEIQAKVTAEVIEKYTPQADIDKEQLEKDIEALMYEYLEKYASKKTVFFIITDMFGKFCITMFYDNEYNRPNGEDL